MAGHAQGIKGEYTMSELKCVHCGAPLPEPKEGQEYITCEFCGYTNRIKDSTTYMEQLKLEIQSWLKTLVPANIISAGSAVDVVSRHNIFTTIIKPDLLSKHLEVKSRIAHVISTPLIFLPYWDVYLNVDIDPPKKAFEEAAKIESVRPLAVVDEDASFINKVTATQYMYAYFSNFVNLVNSGERDPELISNNFKKIAEAFEGVPEGEAPKLRFEGLYHIYAALDRMLDGDMESATVYIKSGKDLLSKAKETAVKNPEYVPMIPAIEKELSLTAAIENLIEGLSATVNPMEYLVKLKMFFKASEEARKTLAERYHLDSKDFGRYTDIIREVKNILLAKNGIPAINLVGSPRKLLLPFWRIQLTYTFTTGSLFWKKGKAITDELLILATIPYATQPITDIFKIKPKGGMLDSFLGKEVAMTTGYIRELAASSRPSSISTGTVVIPPMITNEEAKMFSDWYIRNVTQRTNNKVKFGVSKLMGIVYLGAEIRGDDVYIPELKEFQVSVKGYLENLERAAL